MVTLKGVSFSKHMIPKVNGGFEVHHLHFKMLEVYNDRFVLEM